MYKNVFNLGLKYLLDGSLKIWLIWLTLKIILTKNKVKKQ